MMELAPVRWTQWSVLSTEPAIWLPQSRLWRTWLLACIYVMSGAGHSLLAEQPVERKLLVGYQGWFRCPGDGSPEHAWSHWSHGVPSSSSMTVDLYPDLSEFQEASLCPVSGMTIGGKPAYLFTSYPLATAETHFAWMQQYGIDGALAQRFVNDIPTLKREGDVVLRNVMTAAHDHHRSYAVEYDVSGCDPATVFQLLQADWLYLNRSFDIVKTKEYLRLRGKPVVSIWGLGFTGHHIDDPVLAMRILRWFHAQHVLVMGGTPAGWRTLSGDSTTDPRWRDVYAAMDIVQPWTVGRYRSIGQVQQWNESHTRPDIELTSKHNQIYMPVIFPGFSWHNLNPRAPANQIPRAGGRFLWEQAYGARRAGATLLKIAMFDEVNEGTAIFKAAPSRSNAPQQGYWLTLDADGANLPADWYLRIAQRISVMVHGALSTSDEAPIPP